MRWVARLLLRGVREEGARAWLPCSAWRWGGARRDAFLCEHHEYKQFESYRDVSGVKIKPLILPLWAGSLAMAWIGTLHLDIGSSSRNVVPFQLFIQIYKEAHQWQFRTYIYSPQPPTPKPSTSTFPSNPPQSLSSILILNITAQDINSPQIMKQLSKPPLPRYTVSKLHPLYPPRLSCHHCLPLSSISRNEFNGNDN